MAQWGSGAGGDGSNKNWHDQPMLPLRHIGNIALKCEASAINNLQIPPQKKKKKERQQQQKQQQRGGEGKKA